MPVIDRCINFLSPAAQFTRRSPGSTKLMLRHGPCTYSNQGPRGKLTQIGILKIMLTQTGNLIKTQFSDNLNSITHSCKHCDSEHKC